jgi:CDP-glucose 4,6-dehydratase
MTFWKDRSVLITGCTGFLGYALTKELIGKGADLVGLVRDRVARSPFFLDGLHDRINIVHGPVEDYETVQRVINEYAVDTVFHVAAQSIVGVANRSPMSTFEANIKGTWVVLEACRRSPTVTRVVVASSDKAYGEHTTLPYDESFPLRGNHPYDVSKSCADLIATAYHTTYGTPVCITRCGNLFGPGDLNFNRIVPGTFRSILNGERPIIRSDGSPMRDYLFVGDAAQAYLLLAERMSDGGVPGKAFNFGTGEPVTVLDLTHRMLKVADREDLEPLVQNTAHGEILNQYLSASLAKTTLGWKPGAALDARLRETFAWYQANHDRDLTAAVAKTAKS